PQTAEPAVLTIGWWWKDAQSEVVDIQGNQVSVDTPSPFCPHAPGSLGAAPGTCAEQRFPVEIRGGDYDEPHMLSGLGFDLSFLTPGSEVFEFKLTLLEAEGGCKDGPDQGTDCTPGSSEGDHIEATDPIGPVDERRVRACLLTQIFGDADGRPYDEVPNYDCPDGAPTAKRKEIKAVDEDDSDGVDHVWTFDLTPYAQEWAEAFSVTTNIMLTGVPPKETGEDDNWRVVFAGPRVERGIVTRLKYEPAEIEVPPTVPPTTTGGGSTFTGAGSTFTGGTGSPTTDFGSGDVTGGGTPTTDATPEPGANPGTDLASGEGPAIEGMPAYMWLAILAGLIGFTMFRQVVIEQTTGIRPDGVLAKIHALNAQRRGIDAAELAAESGGVLTGLGTIAGALGHRLSGLKSKLPFGRE
ncbi:MAG: hypothetical protein M3161_06645, partial [Actinomycetota bacterium]|nr:hypothetical protein [Actinomycetota bacterium]